MPPTSTRRGRRGTPCPRERGRPSRPAGAQVSQDDPPRTGNRKAAVFYQAASRTFNRPTSPPSRQQGNTQCDAARDRDRPERFSASSEERGSSAWSKPTPLAADVKEARQVLAAQQKEIDAEKKVLRREYRHRRSGAEGSERQAAGVIGRCHHSWSALSSRSRARERGWRLPRNARWSLLRLPRPDRPQVSRKCGATTRSSQCFSCNASSTTIRRPHRSTAQTHAS